MAFSTF